MGELKFSHLLVVWSLGPRACQIRFLLKRLQPLLGIQLQVREFPFTLYPLYFRSVKGIWKPVVIKKVVEFGAALWLDPELQPNEHIRNTFSAIEQDGFVAGNFNSSCSSMLVGFQKENQNAYNILKKWSKLTLRVMISNCTYSSIMVKAS